MQLLCVQHNLFCKYRTDTWCILIDAVVVALALLFPELVVHGVQTLACLTYVCCSTELPKSWFSAHMRAQLYMQHAREVIISVSLHRVLDSALVDKLSTCCALPQVLEKLQQLLPD